MENEIYVACWLDGDKAIMMAGTRNPEGFVKPLAVERRSNPGANSVVNGVIAVNDGNRNIVAALCKCIANRLTTTLNETYTIRGLYFGAMPRSLRSIRTSGEKVLDTRNYVREADVDECRSLAYSEAASFGEVLALYDSGFELDSAISRHAVGEVAKKVRLNALSVVVGKRFSTDYKALMPKDVTLFDVMPAGIAVASAVTHSDERLNGVLSVHFCSTTTLFTAYRDDQVIATCVVPFGEDDVIHDMCHGNFKSDSWRTLYDNWDFVSGAANIKISDGTAKHSLDTETIERMRFAAETRISEIYSIALEWLRNQISDFDSLIHSIVFTGSLSDKLGFIQFVDESLLPGHTCQCRCGNIMDVMKDEAYSGDADYLPLVGMLQKAAQNCMEHKVTPKMDEISTPAEQPAKAKETKDPKSPSFIHKLFNSLADDSSL